MERTLALLMPSNSKAAKAAPADRPAQSPRTLSPVATPQRRLIRPAMPLPGANPPVFDPSIGAKLLDYFAANAPEVPAWFRPNARKDAVHQLRRLVAWRFHYADAMLAERAERK